MSINDLRKEYHQRICQEIVRVNHSGNKGEEYPNFADGSSRSSVQIAWHIVHQIGCSLSEGRIKEQTAGGLFEMITKGFVEKAFELLQHLRPGHWHYSTTQTAISGFDQYEHLASLDRIVQQDKDLSSALGRDYVVKPDIIVARNPVSDKEINRFTPVLETDDISGLTPLRERNCKGKHTILHASISCKWTIRSDRSQNTRTEALNLIRNRKGNLPHVVAVTAEPLPTRISALALGTGDLDCVYHFALHELRAAINESGNDDQLDMLNMMVEGRRLRDISDLPFDLAI
jgi:hypothetical protein